MRNHLFNIGLASTLLLLFFPFSKAESPAPVARLDDIRRGMTMDEVRPLVGLPQQIHRQILLRRHLEQWQFAEPAGLIEWNCQRGEVPYVLQSQKFKEN